MDKLDEKALKTNGKGTLCWKQKSKMWPAVTKRKKKKKGVSLHHAAGKFYKPKKASQDCTLSNLQQICY